MVRAPWRHGETREQGSRTGRCGWITSFLRSFKFLVEDTDLWHAGNGSPGTLFSSERAGGRFLSCQPIPGFRRQLFVLVPI
jgi:hypothetical protein